MAKDSKLELKHMFDANLLKRIAIAIAHVYPAFDQKKLNALKPQLDPLEMKARVQLIRDELRQLLPQNYKTAISILRKAIRSTRLQGFDLWPFTEFVQTYGLDEPTLSLEALKDFTKLFTSEWAVRPFLIRHPTLTLKFLNDCARSQDEHLRRWACEGTRPRLPWGERLQDFVKDPKPTQPILERLKFDEALYVRKSVSNHLNDISKDHPDYVITLLSRWKDEAGAKHEAKIDWIVRRSLRTLIKEGHSGALKIVGVSAGRQIKVVRFKIAQTKIRLGEKFDFEFELKSSHSKAQKLVVDYIIHFVKANGGTAPKVFKLKTATLPANGSLTFAKSHAIRQITTRDYYPGLHHLEIQVNGLVIGKQSWELLILKKRLKKAF